MNNTDKPKISVGFIVYIISATFILYLLAFQDGIELEISTRIIMFIFMMFPFVFLPIFIVALQYKDIKERERIRNLSETEKQKYYQQKEKENLDRTIDYTIIIAEDSKKSLGSAIARGAIGGTLLGPVGLVGGAISGKNKSETTFTVVYKSGRKQIVTVSNDSEEFENYAMHIK